MILIGAAHGKHCLVGYGGVQTAASADAIWDQSLRRQQSGVSCLRPVWSVNRRTLSGYASCAAAAWVGAHACLCLQSSPRAGLCSVCTYTNYPVHVLSWPHRPRCTLLFSCVWLAVAMQEVFLRIPMHHICSAIHYTEDTNEVCCQRTSSVWN